MGLCVGACWCKYEQNHLFVHDFWYTSLHLLDNIADVEVLLLLVMLLVVLPFSSW
jgi:hypothetical protein